MTDLKLTVVEIREETPLIRSVTLASGGAEPLPGYCAGAHLTFSSIHRLSRALPPSQ